MIWTIARAHSVASDFRSNSYLLGCLFSLSLLCRRGGLGRLIPLCHSPLCGGKVSRPEPLPPTRKTLPFLPLPPPPAPRPVASRQPSCRRAAVVPRTRSPLCPYPPAHLSVASRQSCRRTVLKAQERTQHFQKRPTRG